MAKQRAPSANEVAADATPTDMHLRQRLRTISGPAPNRADAPEAAAIFLDEMEMIAQASCSTDNRRLLSMAALQVVLRLQFRLGAEAAHRALISDLIAALADADKGVVAPLLRPRRWSRDKGRKPIPMADQTFRDLIVEAANMLMELGMVEVEATEALGRLLELHGFPVRRSGSAAEPAASPGAPIRKWREDTPTTAASGFPAKRSDLAAPLAHLRQMPTEMARQEVLGAVAEVLTGRGYWRK